MTITGRVRDWHDEEGWGVIESDATPGGCWAHYSIVLVPGFKRLEAGQHVEFTYEAAAQEGHAYRATEVWPIGQQPFRDDRPGAASSGSAYSSSVTIRIDGREVSGAGGDFTAARVEKLTDALYQVMGEAKNFRHLRGDETITLIVTGPGEGPNGSILTLTAKRSAVEDFARGKLPLDEFKKKHPVVIY